MDLFYLCSYSGEDVKVDSDLFAVYIGILLYVLDYDLKSEIKYLDFLGGNFRCFYYIDYDNGFKVYVGFNNVEV